MHQTCREPRPVHEYDLFIPLFYNDGRPIEATKFQALQKWLLEQFGGLTFFPQPNQGLWKMGAVVYRDEIVIYSGSIHIQNHPYVRILQHESQAFPRIGQLKRIDK